MLTNEQTRQLETPCVVIDMEKTLRNIAEMQAHADKCGVKLRPHVKTHKNIELARLQVAYGAAGITVAKPSEAEVFVNGGLRDIFIAYPLIGENKLRRALSVWKKAERLILAVDSIEGAEALDAFAVKEGVTFEVRVEVDTGAGRTGVTEERLAALGSALVGMNGLCVTGVYTFKSVNLDGEATTDARAAAKQEGELLTKAAVVLRGCGLIVSEISGGSTPTGMAVAVTGAVSEIRPGTYIFHDYMTHLEGACGLDDVAAFVYATVVSAPSPGLAVIDAGCKAFGGDVRLNGRPFPLPGFAVVPGDANLVLDRLNEEHGIIRAIDGETGLRVGQILRLIPSHICTSINQQDEIYVLEGGNLRKARVDARGRLW